MTLSCHNAPRLSANRARCCLIPTTRSITTIPRMKQAMDAVAEKAKRALGLDEDEFRKAFTHARATIKGRLGGTAACHSRLLYMQQTLELLGLKTQLFMALDLEQTYWRTFMTSAKLFPGAKEFLQSLRRAGIATSVVTDLAAQIQFRKLIYFDLDDCFDFVVTSEEAGAEKPATAPFELALGKLEASADEAFMIGDEAVTDIAGARKRHSPPFKNAMRASRFSPISASPILCLMNYPELQNISPVMAGLRPLLKRRPRKNHDCAAHYHSSPQPDRAACTGLPPACWVEVDVDMLDGVVCICRTIR